MRTAHWIKFKTTRQNSRLSTQTIHGARTQDLGSSRLLLNMCERQLLELGGGQLAEDARCALVETSGVARDRRLEMLCSRPEQERMEEVG